MKRYNSKIIFVVILVLALVFLVSCSNQGSTSKSSSPLQSTPAESLESQPEAPRERIPMSIGGSNPGGTAYIVGTAYADVINANVPYVNITHEVTAGGKDNIELTQSGETDFGCGFSAFLYEAYRGIGDYEGNPHEDLRAFIPWFQYPVQIVTLADSDIQTVSDLQGKRVGVNVKGAGGYKTSVEVFSTLGLEEGTDYKPYYLAFQEAVDAMKLGKIDAQIFTTGAPIPAVMEMGTTHDFRVIPFTQEEMNIICEKYPYYSPGVMTAGTYSNITEDIPTLMCYTIMFANANVPEETAYDILKAIWDNKATLEMAHANQKDMSIQLVENGIIGIAPLHPGAERFYKELGVKTE